MAIKNENQKSCSFKPVCFKGILEFQDISDEKKCYLQDYDLLDNFLTHLFETLKIGLENRIHKIFESKNSSSSSTGEGKEIERIKIVYLLSSGEFNILTNALNNTITLDFSLFARNEEEQNEFSKTEKLLERTLCEFFGWENCFTNIIFNRGDVSMINLREEYNNQMSILKNVKLTSRQVFGNDEYRVYNTMLLDTILIKNESLIFCSKLFDKLHNLILNDLNENDVEKELSSIRHYSDYFPSLSILFDQDQERKSKSLFDYFKIKDERSRQMILLFEGDFIFSLALICYLLKLYKTNNFKLTIANTDTNALDIINKNLPLAKDLIINLQNNSLFEYVEKSKLLTHSNDSNESKFDLIIDFGEKHDELYEKTNNLTSLSRSKDSIVLAYLKSSNTLVSQ